MKIIATNRRANFDYFILSTLESGISLQGWEVKSIRLGHTSINEAFIQIVNNEIFIKNMYIKIYDKMILPSSSTTIEKADRKLLIKKQQIHKLYQKVKEQGFSIIPTKIYFKNQFIKLEIALAKGKHTYNKKECLKEKDIKMDTDRQIKNLSR